MDGIAYYEVTLRVPVDGSQSDPAKWAWEEMVDSAVEVIDSTQVDSFKSPDFQRVFEETQEELVKSSHYCGKCKREHSFHLGCEK